MTIADILARCPVTTPATDKEEVRNLISVDGEQMRGFQEYRLVRRDDGIAAVARTAASL